MEIIRLPGGEELRLYVARPSAPGPAVIVLHAWWGLVPDFTEVCDRLARAGFLAVAPDLYGGQVARTLDEAERLVEARSAESRVEAAIAAVNWVRAQGEWAPERVGLLGFSLGGAIALHAATGGAADAVVVFYGSTWLDEEARISIPLMGHFAETDEYEPAAEVEALFSRLRSQGTPVTFTSYPGTGHWFFERSRSAYNPEAAGAAWEATLQFLNRHLRA